MTVQYQLLPLLNQESMLFHCLSLMTMVQSLTKTITVRVQNPLPIISVRILDGWVGKQMDRNSPRPEGFIPDAWSHTFDDSDNTFTAPDTCFILIQKGREMVTAGMRVNTLHSWIQQL